MVNCGGLVDLDEFFSLPEDANLWVIDAHRPLNLHNLFGGASSQVTSNYLSIYFIIYFIIRFHC